MAGRKVRILSFLRVGWTRFVSSTTIRSRQARIIHECRSEAVEAEARRGFSQARTTQAYPQWYVEEAEREKPRRARGSDAAVGVHG